MIVLVAWYLDAGLLQHFSFPRWAALLWDGDFERDGLLRVGAQDELVEEREDEDERAEEDEDLQPGQVRRELIGGCDVHERNVRRW